MRENAGKREGPTTAQSTSSQPEQLATELKSCLQPGISNQALLRCPVALDLAIVRAKAASTDPTDRAVAARGLLNELVVRVDGQRNGPVATLLALATGTRGTLLKQRRPLVAQMLGISTEHLRTSGREDRLIEVLADELYAADSAYRLRHKHRTEREREPVDNRVGVNWLERHEAYRRVWTPLNAARADVEVLLGYLRDEESVEPSDLADRLMNITWRWARFQIELESFIRDHGGLWLLSDVDNEFALANALNDAEMLAPGGEADHSWVRTLLKDTRHMELDPFIDKMMQEELGQDIATMWIDWARTCSCNLKQPERTCRVHAWMEAIQTFTRLMNEDWIEVADWYKLTIEAYSDRLTDRVARDLWL